MMYVTDAAGKHAAGGIEVWLHSQFIAQMGKPQKFLSTPRPMGLTFKSGAFHLGVVAAHGLDSSYSQEEVMEYWEDVRVSIRQHCSELPVLLLCDANARLGSSVSSFVGDRGAERENRNGGISIGFYNRSSSELSTRFVMLARLGEAGKGVGVA